MLSVKGIYERGKVILLEPVPHIDKAEVIVTILEPSLSSQKLTEGTTLPFTKLSPASHLHPLRFLLASEEEKEEEPLMAPFADIEDSQEFAHTLREKAWKRS